MIRDLDDTLAQLLQSRALDGSELSSATISFDLPDASWRAGLETLTVNCYLYDIRENKALRTNEQPIQRSADLKRAIRRRAPVRIDCAYCITSWSPATEESILEEHRLLSQVLRVLLQHPTIPADALQGGLISQIPPFPTVIASAEGVKNQPEFWGALDQQLKPSLNYVVTLAMSLDDSPGDARLMPVVDKVDVNADDMSRSGV